MANTTGIPAKYMEYIVAAATILVVLYVVANYYKESAMFGLTYQGA